VDLSLQVGKYDIQKALGKGATGTVYLAKDTFTGKEVALKTIEPEVFRDPEFGTVYRSQFLNEASLAGKLRHPHIVSILDAVVGEDSGHIAMELVTGGDLSQHAKPGTLLPVPDVLQIAFKCCGALDYAAKEGIVHRDIKPANIMIAGGTEVKIADFGAAVLKKSQVVQTAALGSPYYMSPEQVQGKTLTFHSDMYSLGVVLYELLTGTRPFLAENIDALIGKILKTDAVPPSELRQGLPKALDSVVLRALKKDAAQRYQTWPDFALELSKVGELVLPAGAIPDSEKYVTLKKVAMLAPLADSELWELARAGKWTRVPKGKPVVQEEQKGRSFFFLAKGEAKVIKNKKLLNMVNGGECFGEMAYIGGGEQPRHATVEAMSELLLAEFEPAALEKMSLGAQLHLTRALVRNVTDRLALANVRLAR
jgi:eukaryotic-like serine/threonine-protein kinase